MAFRTDFGQRRQALLQAELERMLPILTKMPEVRQVILFGSLARGDVHKTSDIDILVVAASDEPFTRRADKYFEQLDPRVATPTLLLRANGITWPVSWPSRQQKKRSKGICTLRVSRKCGGIQSVNCARMIDHCCRSRWRLTCSLGIPCSRRYSDLFGFTTSGSVIVPSKSTQSVRARCMMADPPSQLVRS